MMLRERALSCPAFGQVVACKALCSAASGLTSDTVATLSSACHFGRLVCHFVSVAGPRHSVALVRQSKSLRHMELAPLPYKVLQTCGSFKNRAIRKLLQDNELAFGTPLAL